MATEPKPGGTGCLGCTLIGIPVLFILFITIIMAWKSYNGMITREEGLNAQWGQVENTYQRRADLIGNLAATVKAYAVHENSTFNEVIEARSKATSMTFDVDELSGEAVSGFQEAQDGLSSAFSKLLAVGERYPDLKANQNYMKIQIQLEEIENLILIQRNLFNERAQEYNIYIRKFPKNIFSAIFGFDPKGYFEATNGAEKVPEVTY